MSAAAAARARWLAGGETATFELREAPRRIFVRAAGSGGRTLLFLHGFPTSSWDWHAIEPELLTGRRLLYFDFLGFGASDKPAGHRYDLCEQADLAEAVARRFGVREAEIVAHDIGASVAQELLARDADGTLGFRLARVTLLNGGIYPELHRPVTMQKLLRSPLGPLIARLVTERRFAATLASVFSPSHRPDSDELHEHWEAFSQSGGARQGHALIRYIDDRLANRARWVGALENTRIPLQFVWGMRDPVSGAHVMERLHQRFDGRAAFVELPDAGHYPALEEPLRVAQAIGTA